MELKKIIGKKVHSVKGALENKKQKYVEAKYILFDDGETYIELEEQDYSYHDCASYARILHVYNDKKVWNVINTTHPNATTDP